MSDLVSLCVIRIEMDEDSSSNDNESKCISDQDVRSSQKITVETYASKLAGPQQLHLLPMGCSRESSLAPGDDKLSSADGASNQDETKDCEEVDFFFGNPLVEVTKGILHLYKENDMTDASAEAPSRILCLLAVPAAVSCRDLLAFIAACQQDIQHVRILRERDSTADRYMALLTFRSRGAAFEFRETFGGAPYSSLEPGFTCHAAWVRRVECFRGTPPPPVPATELPTCPVCLERMDESLEGLLTVQCAHAFHAGCLSAWRDGSCPVCRCAQSPDPPAASECAQCAAEGHTGEAVEGGALWICLICGLVGCGRYQAGHAIQHFKASNHTYALQLGSNRVWDYAGDNFVHRLLQNKGDGKLVAAGGPTDPETCYGPADQEKIDSIQLECAHLLATQLDQQRHHYEEILAKEKAAAEIEALALKERLDEAERSRNQLSKKINNLSAKVSSLQTQLAEEKIMAQEVMKAREELTARANTSDATIADLQEQVRDLAFFVQASNAIESRNDLQELQGGQAGVAPSAHKKKGNRRR